MTDYSHITPQMVLDQVLKVASENPDFIYRDQDPDNDDCSYLGMSVENPDKGSPCIVGRALQDLGMPRKDLFQHEGLRVGEVLHRLSGVKSYDDFCSGELIGVLKSLRTIQDNQDDGASWGEAVKYVTLPQMFEVLS